MPFKLGKLPARPGAISLRMADYVDLSRFPTPPSEFGHDALVNGAWGILGNDKHGNCVVAGGAHETMLWNSEAGRQVDFTDGSVLSDYSAVTGFDPARPDTDQGTDMQVAAKYRQDVGLLDAAGKRHKVGAYLSIEAGNVDEHIVAAYLFGAVGVGILFPSTAMAQFEARHPWSVVAGSRVEGGHYVPAVARRGDMFVFVSWGAEQPATDEFFRTENDESVAYVSEEMLTGGMSPEGFDLEHLNADLAALNG